LADVAKLLGELQQPHLATNDLLVLGHVRCPHRNAEAGRATPTSSAPGLGFRLSYDTGD
jgi:hypothetical protein